MIDYDIPDPFPSDASPIIPVDEEDVEDPDTGSIEAADPLRAQELARQRVRATAQTARKMVRKFSPASGTPRQSGRPQKS